MRRLDAYYLGWSPSTFYRVYSIQVALLLALRWVVYRVKRWHYYLLDFCYFGEPSPRCEPAMALNLLRHTQGASPGVSLRLHLLEHIFKVITSSSSWFACQGM